LYGGVAMTEWVLYFKYTLAMAAAIDNSVRGCSDKRPFTIDNKLTVLHREIIVLTATNLKV